MDFRSKLILNMSANRPGRPSKISKQKYKEEMERQKENNNDKIHIINDEVKYVKEIKISFDY